MAGDDDPVPPPGAHGGDAQAVAAALGIAPAELLDLSASLNPRAPELTTVAAHALERGVLHRYPNATPATRALAAAIEVDSDRLVLTNGGAEAIALVAGLHPVGAVDEPEFSLYARHLREVRPGAPRWRSNPHNPSGALAASDERAFVWDEAFWPLATGTWTRGDSEAWRIGSLTKLWACPGLRLGYVIAPSPNEALALSTRQPRWAVNALAAAVVEPLLEQTDLPAWCAAVDTLRLALVDVLAGHGLAAEATQANWVLVPGLAAYRVPLAHQRVLIRDCASFGLPGVARVAVPDEAGLERLDAALAAVTR